MPDTADTCELYAYSTYGRWELQAVGCWADMHLSVFFRLWFVCSTWLLNWGWWPEDRLTDVPRAAQNACHTLEVNCGSRSLTMFRGRP